MQKPESLNSPHVWSWSNAKGLRGKVTLNTRYRASNGDALLDAAIRGLGVLRLPTFIVNQAIDEGSLQPSVCFPPASTDS